MTAEKKKSATWEEETKKKKKNNQNYTIKTKNLQLKIYLVRADT